MMILDPLTHRRVVKLQMNRLSLCHLFIFINCCKQVRCHTQEDRSLNVSSGSIGVKDLCSINFHLFRTLIAKPFGMPIPSYVTFESISAAFRQVIKLFGGRTIERLDTVANYQVFQINVEGGGKKTRFLYKHDISRKKNDQK